MASPADANPVPTVPDAEPARRDKRRAQRQKYRQRQKARQAAEHDGGKKDERPVSMQNQDATTNDPAAADAKSLAHMSVKTRSGVGHGTPKSSAINNTTNHTKPSDAETAADTSVKEAQGQGRKRPRKAKYRAQEDEKRQDSMPGELPVSSHSMNSIDIRDSETYSPTIARTIEIHSRDKSDNSVDKASSHGETEAVEVKSCAATRSSQATAPSTSQPQPHLLPVPAAGEVVLSFAESVPTSSTPASESSAVSQHTSVVDQPHDNLYTMIRQRRELLFQGPFIAIHIGERSVTGIYKRVAMATSTVLYKHFSQNPESLDFTVQDRIAPEAVEYMLVTWMNDIRHEFEVVAMPLQSSFSNNVALLRAARKLGMEPYTKWILTTHVEYLRDNIPSYEEITLIEHNRSSDIDPIWTFMVNHLSHVRHRCLVPDPEVFALFLKGHPDLSAAMNTADAFFAARAEKARRDRWEQNEAEKLARIAREQEAVASLSRKMEDKSGSGLLLVTEAEAALLRR